MYASVVSLQKSYKIAETHPIVMNQPEKYAFSSILLGLNEYTTYSVSVAANNSFGIGPYSQPVEVKTQESSKFIHQ